MDFHLVLYAYQRDARLLQAEVQVGLVELEQLFQQGFQLFEFLAHRNCVGRSRRNGLRHGFFNCTAASRSFNHSFYL